MKNHFKRLNQRSFSVLSILLAVTISMWFIFSKPSVVPSEAAEDVYAVDVINVKIENIQPEISVFGIVRAARISNINSLVGGRVVSISPKFRDGVFVSSGSELLVIDPVEYELLVVQRQAEVQRIEAVVSELQAETTWASKIQKNSERQSALAQRAFDRFRNLEDKGLASKKARDDAELVFFQAEQVRLQGSQTHEKVQSRVVQQEANLKSAEAALSIARRDLSNTRLLAAFDGYLTGINVALGQRISPGETIGQLLSATDLEVAFDVPEDNFLGLLMKTNENNNTVNELVSRRPVAVFWKLGSESKRFDGRLARFGAKIDPELGGIKFYASLNKGAHLEGLRAGAFVEVRLKGQVYEDAFRFPSTAVTSESTIYLVENDRLRSIDVTILKTIGDELIVEANFPSGELVVVSRVFPQIGDGLKVKPRASYLKESLPKKGLQEIGFRRKESVRLLK
jgi:membrane fusion protein, multidrug efflux system